MPPPPPALFPEMVESSTVSVPELEMPPPASAAALPEMVESSTVSVPELEMPPPSVKAEPSSMLTPERVAVTEEFTPSTLAPSPSKVTMLPGVVGCTVIEVGMVKLVSLAGSIGAGSEVHGVTARRRGQRHGQRAGRARGAGCASATDSGVQGAAARYRHRDNRGEPDQRSCHGSDQDDSGGDEPKPSASPIKRPCGCARSVPPPCSKPSPEGTCGRP